MKRLTYKELKDIREKFVEGHYYVNCDDFHAHGFECLSFKTETAEIIERLRLEILFYKRAIDEFADQVKND